MTIRPATADDLPDILGLYQLTMGDLDGMRTEAYWRWKHEQNPFGPSPVLLAFHDNRLVGMRAFLRWRFCHRGHPLLAYRAVDTATHPEFRGKGIFSKLTMSLVKQVAQGEPCLIFNTPNAQSKPGYLKMGWQVFGKTPLKVKVFPHHFLMRARNQPVIAPSGWSDEEGIDALLQAWQRDQSEAITTAYSMHYLRWRYQDVPVLTYYQHREKVDHGDALVMYRIKSTKGIQELRIADLFFSGANSRSAIRRALSAISNLHRPDVITILANKMTSGVLPLGFVRASRFGLTITYRHVNNESWTEKARHPEEWNFSSGTLELF